MKKLLMTLAAARIVLTAFLCCMLTAAVLTACSDSDDKQDTLVPGLDIRIVGNWCSNVSGKTYARWNYGETWQMTGDELIINDGDGVSLTFKKTTSDMAAQFETWDQSVIPR